MLQYSLGAQHEAGQVQLAWQVQVPAATPAPPQVVQVALLPAQQTKPLSQAPSQSSSTPLQDSIGGWHVPQAQPAPQKRLPVLPQEVAHEPVVPRQQPGSSQVPSQSSSILLQVSAGGVQVPQPQELLQVCDPAVMHVVVQGWVAPRQQPGSSQAPSQSSSLPLQTSAGVWQGSHVQPLLQALDPVVPHEVEQLPLVPLQHSDPSSQAPSQLSSAPLQAISPGGVQADGSGMRQSDVQVPVPVEPQAVAQGTPVAP
jgi:hypothetical protein